MISKQANLSMPKVLAVDDSPSILLLYQELLGELNALTDVAFDGEEGLLRAQSGEYDLIITDINMPKMNGIELSSSLRSYPETASTPILIISTFDTDKDIETGFLAGATAYLSKNEIKQQLVKTASELLWKKQQVHQRKILIVDDSRSILNFVEQCLVSSGFRVLLARNGKEALVQVEKEPPDLILSDINMPEMDGFALCKAIRSDPSFAALPFVVMSTNDDRAHMDRMIQYGATSYIVKPFNVHQLTVLIEKILSDHYLFLLKEKEKLELEKRNLLGSITSLVSALEARDPYTRGHSDEVSRIASELLAIFGATEEEIQRITVAGQLHDIGKIGVRDAVLLKPGRLSDEEFEHIKQHPLVGMSILQAIPSFNDILDVVHYHHEHWNGAGYPQGLQKTEIPFWARITAVADVYHALTSDRPYRGAMPIEKALEIIRGQREVQLCPECVDLFFDWIN